MNNPKEKFFKLNIKNNLNFDCEDESIYEKFLKVRNKISKKYMYFFITQDGLLQLFPTSDGKNISNRVTLEVDELGLTFYNETFGIYFRREDLEEILSKEFVDGVKYGEYNEIDTFLNEIYQLNVEDALYRGNKNLILLKSGKVFSK